MADPRAHFEGTHPWTPEALASSGWRMLGTVWVAEEADSRGRRMVLFTGGESDRVACGEMTIKADG